MTRSHLLLALAALAVTSCRIQQPPTVVPPPPVIEALTASSLELAAPGAVTLTWKTSNTTSVQLRSGQELLAVPEDTLSGSFEVHVERSTVFVLVARGEGGSEARALAVNVAGAPPALTLVALPAIIQGGSTTTLAWTAPGAQAVTLLAGSTPIDTRGQITSGAVVVRPERDTVYTLTDGARAVTTSVTVQVALLSLTVTPAAAQVGDTLTISWTSAGADRVIIASPGRGELAEITDPARLSAGTFTDVVPPLPRDGVLTYEVTALKGSASMKRSSTVFIGSQLAIVRMEAPPVAKAGEQYFVRWTTVAADRVQVLVEGQALYETPTLQLATQGGFGFTAPDDDFQVVVVALNDRGDRVTQSEQVDAVGVPTSATLTATPATVAAGSPVTLTFAADEARRLRIVDSLGHAVFSTLGQNAESGTATVYPSQSTTYTLTADNLLGDPAVTATAQVTVTGTPDTVRQVPATAISGQVVELTPTVPGALLYGFPHDTVLTSAVSNFHDISSTGERVLEMGGDVARVTLPFSTRLWGELKEGPLTISRAGWMAWGAPLTVNTSDQALPGTAAAAARGIIAPYWDDLRLTAISAVLVEVIGDAPEQRLIVQWNNMQAGTDTDSLLTFQVQVHQSGTLSFRYHTMNLNASPSFTVGLQDMSRQLGFDLPTAPESNSAIYFFSPLSVPAAARVFAGSTWGGFVKTGASYQFVGQPAVAVRLPFDIALSELMFRPAPGVIAGQYLEAVNLTANTYDLGGWSLLSNDGSSFTLPAGTTLPPNGQLVVGASIDPAENGDAGVTVSWAGSGFSLALDAGTLTIGTTDAGVAVPYSGPADGGFGVSTEFDPGPFLVLANTTAPTTCEASATFGSQRGSPGWVPGCGFAYQRQGVPNRFHDISATGTVLLQSATNLTNQNYRVTLAALPTDPAPRLFGARTTAITVNSNGFISPNVITVSGSTNKSVPTGSDPVGTIAPFWDALEALGGVSTIHWQRLEPNEDPQTPERHWIIQWTDMNTASAAAATPDELTFQVKLFEDGSIEFHYREMRSGSTSDFGEGASATVWVEEPTGTRALSVSYNTRAPRENTAIRFVAR